MATSNNAGQTGQDVNYHKRIAMGANLDGSSLGGNGDSAPRRSAQKVDTTNRRPTRTGGLQQASKK